MQTEIACPACAHARYRRSSAGGGTFAGYEYEYVRCAECQSLFVTPAPSTATLEEMYSPQYVNEHYADLDATVASELSGTADLAAQLRPSGKLLDVGCGAGAFLREARSRGFTVHGFELNEETARQVTTQAGCPVFSKDLSRVEGPYDVVHMADVLEHLRDPLEMLVQARRLAGPGGIVIARGPLEAQPTPFDLAMRLRRRLMAFQERPQSRLPPWHLILFSLDGWRALSRRAQMSFSREDLSEVTWPAPAHGYKRSIKDISISLSMSSIGKRLRWGNRVVSVLASSDSP